jgi:predicted nicotinamide N-methyase
MSSLSSHKLPLTRQGDRAFFMNRAIRHREIRVDRNTILLDGLEDAAELLELPEFAERFNEKDMAPYGMELWPAAIMLARRIAVEPPGQGRSALELGCGLGLVSIVAARYGWMVTASDNDETALRFARHNAGLNDTALHEVTSIDWRRPPADRRWSRIFAADVLYQTADHAPVLQCIKTLLAADGEAWVADPNRTIADDIEETARQAGLVSRSTESRIALDSNAIIQGRVFKISHD